eukprot:15465831-Alexandrium_andersonii.AAC.1
MATVTAWTATCCTAAMADAQLTYRTDGGPSGRLRRTRDRRSRSSPRMAASAGDAAAAGAPEAEGGEAE